MLERRAGGYSPNIKYFACTVVILRDGRGLHGLSRLSSSTASGCRWLSIANGSRFIQVHNTTGVNERALNCLFWAVLGARRPLKIPRALFGPTIVFKSLNAESHKED